MKFGREFERKIESVITECSEAGILPSKVLKMLAAGSSVEEVEQETGANPIEIMKIFQLGFDIFVRIEYELGFGEPVNNASAFIDEKDDRDNIIPKDGVWSAYTDGASRGNPGPSGLGFVIKDQNGQTVCSNSEYLGTKTNNEAEYEALIAALSELARLEIREAVIYADSELMVKQMKGQYKVRNLRLQELHRRASALARNFKSLRFEHVPRAQNAEADALANEGIDNG
jgi:ribonuclease HI